MVSLADELESWQNSPSTDFMTKSNVMRANVKVPDYPKNLAHTQILIDICLTFWFALLKILRCSISSNTHFQLLLKPLLPNALSPPLLICCSVSLCLIPFSILPLLISHKYVDLLRGYHWINLIEIIRMFHLGIAHNNCLLSCIKTFIGSSLLIVELL
jgi:hypothetical protein